MACSGTALAFTRPDIAHVTSVLSQLNTGFTEEHWKAAKRVLRYLKGTMNLSCVQRYR
jgi:hypothetical protein